jgi:uncharacterized protein
MTLSYDLLALVPLGLLAGVLTTVAGMGGGMMLVVVLSLMWDPRIALASTAPALLIGNAHRAYLYRAQIDRSIAKPFVLGAIPGSFLGGLAVVVIPELLLNVVLVGMTLLAFARSAGLFRWEPRAAQLAPAGVVIGATAATGGGAGMLIGPLFLSAGLRGEPYIATIAICAVAMHLGRLAAYGIGGLIDRSTLVYAAVLTVAILAGNALGAVVRRHVDEKTSTRLELGTLTLAVIGALIGLA